MNLSFFRKRDKVSPLQSVVEDMTMEETKEEKFSIFSQSETKLDGKTCCCIGRTCCCRTALFDICYNPITNFCRFYLTILNTGFFVYISQTDLDLDFTLINYLCLLLLSIDVALQIGALGLIRGKHTFLTSDIWNAVDFFIVIIGWPLIYFVQLTPFRILVMFRLITKLPFLSALQAILHSFWAVIPKLRGLFVLIIVVYLIFVLGGLDLFKGDIGRQCVYIEENSLISTQNDTIKSIGQLEDLHIDYEPVIPTTWCSHVGFGIKCDEDANFYCMDGNEAYYLGVGSFDIWPKSLLVSFQMISLSGWSQYYVALRGVEGWIMPMVWVLMLIFWIVFVVFNIVISAIENAFGLKREHMSFEAAKSKNIPNQTLYSRIFSDVYGAFGGKVFYFLQRRVFFYDCCCGIRQFFITIITSYAFDICITIIITINILLEFLIPDIQIANFVSVCFMFFYLLESLVKITVIGPHYFNNFYNLLDTFLVVCSIGLFIITQATQITDEVYSTLYVIRLVRTISILSRFPITRGFMKRVSYSVIPAISLIFFSGCVLFIFATLAHMIFDKISRQEPRGFNSIGESILTLFVMLTGDNWEDNMFDPLSRTPNGEDEQKLYEENPQMNETKTLFAIIVSGPFFIIFFLVTNLFLLNFFTAVVLHSYSSAKTDEGSNAWEKVKKNFKSFWRWIKRKVLRIKDKRSKIRGVVSSSSSKDEDEEGNKKSKNKKSLFERLNPCSLCCGCLRWGPRMIRKSRIYYLVMLSFSLLAVVVLVFDDLPTVDRSQGYPISFWMFVIDCVLLGVFLIDLLLGGMAEGTKFLVNLFHLLDILFLWELTITVIFEVMTDRSIPWTIVYIRMVVRSIRPLKVVVQFPDLRIYLNSIKNMVLSFFQLAILILIVFLIYCIIGNKLFKDKFVGCSDKSKLPLNEYNPKEIEYFQKQCVGYFEEPEFQILAPRTFFTYNSNFDNLGSSILTLTELSTLDSWSKEMYHVAGQANDAYSDFYSLYFISFVVVVVLFVITISIGIVLGGIMEERDVDDSTTPLQLNWSYMRRYIYIANPIPKRQPLCGKYICFFPTHWSFKICVLIVIILDYIFISSQWSGQNVIQDFSVNFLSFVCVLLFFVEDIFKLLALGFANFLSDLWNQIDLLILLVSPLVLGFLLYYQIQRMVTVGTYDFEIMRLYLKSVTRVILFLRLLSFATSFKAVKRIFRTLILAIPSIINACILLICIMFGYALLGRMIFGSVRYGEHYNQHVNFRSWDRSVLLLLKLLTFDDWRGIMHDLAVEAPYCTNEERFNDCGREWMSYLFFVSYGIVISTLTLNLFIGIILDNFSIEFLESGFHITRESVDDFKEVWAEFDVNAVGLMKLKRIKDLIPRLFKKKHVLGFDMENSRGNTMYWIVYHELQRRGGMGEFRSENEIRETKYLFRSNIILSIYNFFKSGRKNCWWCMTCCKCCGACSKKQIKLEKRDSLKVSFNDVLLALSRLSLDNTKSSSEARNIEERRLRRLFLQEALQAISSRTFTRSKTDIKMMERLKRKRKKESILQKLKALGNKKKNAFSPSSPTVVNAFKSAESLKALHDWGEFRNNNNNTSQEEEEEEEDAEDAEKEEEEEEEEKEEEEESAIPIQSLKEDNGFKNDESDVLMLSDEDEDDNNKKKKKSEDSNNNSMKKSKSGRMTNKRRRKINNNNNNNNNSKKKMKKRKRSTMRNLSIKMIKNNNINNNINRLKKSKSSAIPATRKDKRNDVAIGRINVNSKKNMLKKSSSEGIPQQQKQKKQPKKRRRRRRGGKRKRKRKMTKNQDVELKDDVPSPIVHSDIGEDDEK